MYKNASIVVVVPAYNEELLIGKVIDTMQVFVDKIVIVNDKSTDGTAKVVEDYSKKNDRVVLINHEKNQGVGGAIATGYEWARDNDYDVAVVMAGDAQMNPDDLPALLEPVLLGKTDYSKGNRLITGEAYQKIPKVRYWGNAILSLLTKIVSGYWHVADSQTGYTAINKRALRAIDWSTMYKRYGQPNDLLVKLNVFGFRVMDVPVEPVYNIGEKSGINVMKVVFSIGCLLFRLFFWRMKEKYLIRDFHPLLFFYFFAICMFLVSSIFFVRFILLWYANGHVPELTMLSWLFATTLSFNSFFFGMWFDYEYNRHLNPDSYAALPIGQD